MQKEAKKTSEKRANGKPAAVPAPAPAAAAPPAPPKRPLAASGKADANDAPFLKKVASVKASRPSFSGRYLGERPEDVDRLVAPPWVSSLPRIGSLRVDKGKVQVKFGL
jgi:hypothetical protein